MKYFLFTIFFAQLVSAAPLTTHSISNAVSSFISLRFAQSQTQKISPSAKIKQSVRLSEIKSLSKNSKTIGYVASLNPTGFVLTRADDELPFTKLYSDSCNFSDLPLDFQDVIKWELSQELNSLENLKKEKTPLPTRFHKQWSDLINNSVSAPVDQNVYVETSYQTIGPLLSTMWNQNSPYNYDAPTASGGPGGRAYAGCVACAMAQIMKHHDHPATGSSSHTYNDNYGSCTGPHSVDYSSTTYGWANMPDTINDYSSTEVQKQAVGKLMYHAGVAVNMNFEATASGSYSEDVPDALRNYFKYDCLDLSVRPATSKNPQWYQRVENDMSKNRPVYYSFSQGANGSGGHAVVVDGCKSGNEFHVNMGWGDSYGNGTAWYNMDNINGFNYNHDAIFGICEEGTLDDAYEPNVSKGEAYDLTTHFDQWLSSISNKGVQVNEDWYKVTIDDAPVLLVITCAFKNAEGDLLLELHDESGIIADSSTTNDGEHIEHYVNSSETYYVKIDSRNGDAYPYQKEYWLNNYDVMVSLPESVSLLTLLTYIIITLRRKA